METPVISIIIATWNSERTLARCLDSLRVQRGAPFELLVSDGGSTDGTLAILDSFRDLVAHQVSGPDAGVYDAWNKVIPAASGEWLMFLGSDDWLERNDVLMRLEQALAAIPPARRRHGYVFGQTEVIARGQTIETLGVQAMPAGRIGPDTEISFSHTGLLHHRSLFESFGPFDHAFRSAGDYEFLLRTGLDERVHFHRVPMVVAHMASGGMSTGALSRHRHYVEMVAARRKLGLRRDPPWLRNARRRAALVLFLHSRISPSVALFAANLYRRIRGKVPRGDLG